MRKKSNGSIRRSDEAFRQVVAMIFEGQLAPGARLPSERDLSEQLKVSRPTLRDALSRLQARGYIEIRPKSGNYVCNVIPQSMRGPLAEGLESRVLELHDANEIRKVLETWAAEEAARSPEPEKLKLLRECVETMRETAPLRTKGQYARHREADRRFHETIAEMTRNPVYQHLIRFLTGVIRKCISVSRELMPDDYGQQNLREHEAVYEAIRRADVAQTRKAMIRHFEFVERNLPARRIRRKPFAPVPKA
jgi:GntR family transcriptional repressor for pyruvate dehydrogenase complex